MKDAKMEEPPSTTTTTTTTAIAQDETDQYSSYSLPPSTMHDLGNSKPDPHPDLEETDPLGVAILPNGATQNSYSTNTQKPRSSLRT
jgi:hypothetical protein